MPNILEHFTTEDEVALLRMNGYVVRGMPVWKVLARKYRSRRTVRFETHIWFGPATDEDMYVMNGGVDFLIRIRTEWPGSTAKFFGIPLPSSFRELAGVRSSKFEESPDYVGFTHSDVYRRRSTLAPYDPSRYHDEQVTRRRLGSPYGPIEYRECSERVCFCGGDRAGFVIWPWH